MTKIKKEQFKKLMNSMDIVGIKDSIFITWDAPEGEIFREIGFEILDERLGEEESDRIYAELYAKVRS